MNATRARHARPPGRIPVAFLVVLLLGAAVRVVVIVAYRPAMIFPDSFVYLNRAEDLLLPTDRPAGYSFFLRPIRELTDSLVAVQVVQHILGVALAVGCYALLRRRGLPDWGAALAVVPVLLDPLQLVLEHYVLSDVLFEVLIVLACLLIAWRPQPGTAAVVAAGACIGVAVLVRGAGTFLAVAFIVAMLCLRVRWRRMAAFLVAAGLPVAVYAAAFQHQHGQLAITSDGARFLYARLAPIADCHDSQVRIPAYERALCPPAGSRHDSNWYMWSADGPAATVVPPDGQTQNDVLKDFSKRVVRSQPLTFTRAVLTDFARGFGPVRTAQVSGYPASYWLFADHYWSWDTSPAQGRATPRVVSEASVNERAARFLTSYRTWVYLPGPLAAGLAIAGTAAALGLGRARFSGDRVLIGLLVGSCLLTLLTSAALSGPSWRYQLPQIPMLPMAGALGIAALVRGRVAGRPVPAPPVRVLDRLTGAVAALPMPAAWHGSVRRAAASGRAQTVVAVVAGLLTMVGLIAAGVGSGWFLMGPAAAYGAVCGVLVALTLVVSRRHAEGAPGAAAERPGGGARSDAADR